MPRWLLIGSLATLLCYSGRCETDSTVVALLRGFILSSKAGEACAKRSRGVQVLEGDLKECRGTGQRN